MILTPRFERTGGCGDAVRGTLHARMPPACVADAAFAYVNAFSAHASVGFFHGAALPDPAALLEGAGKRMRHVKLRPGVEVDERALGELVTAAYDDLRRQIGQPKPGWTR